MPLLPLSRTLAKQDDPGTSLPRAKHSASTHTTKPKHAVSSSNLEVKKPTLAKEKSTSTGTGEIAASAVPVPAPDTGSGPLAIHSGILPVVPTSTPTTLTITPSTSATYLPTSSPVPVGASSSVSRATGLPSDTSRALGAGQTSRSGDNTKHPPVLAIVLLTLGVAALLIGGIAFWRMRRRPRKRSCPTPSLPILQDPFSDQPFKADDESLFGGKERTSAVARPNSNGLYPWVQYTPKPSETQTTLSAKGLAPNPPPLGPLPSPPRALLHDKYNHSGAATPIHIPLPIKETPFPPAQRAQAAITRSTNRVSSVSMSIYPMSPQSSHANAGIGLAISTTSPYTADGTPVLERKTSKERLFKARQSYRHSLAATEYTEIYGGSQVLSPVPPSSAPIASTPIKSALRKSTSVHASGRARVKPGYTPGNTNTALRASSTVAGIASLSRANNRVSMTVTGDALHYVLPPVATPAKSDVHRERDTRALASALGLATPTPESPAPTLTPDDSITLAGDRNRRRSRLGPSAGTTHRRAPSEAVVSPMMETNARLGNLLLEDYANLPSLPSSRSAGAAASDGLVASTSKSRVVPRKHVNANAHARVDDRPPRVPSPPPLPSLAQMALEHTNAQEYADYRSPTYSIYGLYEAERKSRI